MKKKSTVSVTQVRISLLSALVLALLIACASFAVGHLAGGGNHSPVLKEKKSEDSQSKTVAPVSAAAGHSVLVSSSTDAALATDSRTCYLTVGYGDNIPEINDENSIAMDIGICQELSRYLVSLLLQDME